MTEETQHTPGPWNITESTGWDEAWCDWHQVGPVSLMGPKANADSRLIAAAPDLLASLKALRDECSQERFPSSALQDMLTDASLAIAKAEGRS